MFTRIKRITSHVGHARFLHDIREGIIGEIPRQKDIASPYASSPSHFVWKWGEKRIIIVETSHKTFDVFLVPTDFPLLPTNTL